jgi:hypothetical protein
MQKYMVADLVKDLKQDQIKYLLDNYNIDRSDAEYIVDNYQDTYIQDLIAKAMDVYGLNMRNAEEFVDNYPNESAWADVEATAESLGVDIDEVDDDDVENYMAMGRVNKGDLQSSIGPIQWVYDNKLKAYLILAYLTFEVGKEPKEVMYKLNPEQFRNWFNSESIGEYWNQNIRANAEIEDDEWSCGCNPNPCDPQNVSRFNTKFVSIS